MKRAPRHPLARWRVQLEGYGVDSARLSSAILGIGRWAVGAGLLPWRGNVLLLLTGGDRWCGYATSFGGSFVIVVGRGGRWRS